MKQTDKAVRKAEIKLKNAPIRSFKTEFCSTFSEASLYGCTTMIMPMKPIKIANRSHLSTCSRLMNLATNGIIRVLVNWMQVALENDVN